jgi:hypothetical protein
MDFPLREEKLATRRFLLAALVIRADFNDWDLNAFLAKSRKLADHWLSEEDPAERDGRVPITVIPVGPEDRL